MADFSLAGLRALLLDLDGVVYRGDTPLPGATEAVDTLRRHGIPYAFVTNNATLTPDQFQAKLNRLGVPATARDVVTSPVATAAYLQGTAPAGTGVCVVGEEGLRQALLEAGFRLDDAAPQFVVVGLDRHVTYERLFVACLAIQHGARLIATNADRALPVEQGLAPGAGALLAAITTATEAEATIIGKPQPGLLQVALQRLGVGLDGAAIIGDQVATDIRAGQAAGIGTILIQGDLAEPDPDAVPDLVVRSLADFLTRLDREHPLPRQTG